MRSEADMPGIIYMRDDGDDGVELTSRDDPAAVGYVRMSLPDEAHPDEREASQWRPIETVGMMSNE